MHLLNASWLSTHDVPTTPCDVAVVVGTFSDRRHRLAVPFRSRLRVYLLSNKLAHHS